MAYDALVLLLAPADVARFDRVARGLLAAVEAAGGTVERISL